MSDYPVAEKEPSTKRAFVTALWVRTIGDNLEFLIEVDDKWHKMISYHRNQPADGEIGHIEELWWSKERADESLDRLSSDSDERGGE